MASVYDERLTTALSRLYDVYSVYRNLSSRFGDCSWLTERDGTILTAKALRQLSADDLSVYFDHASFCGSADDFRHFLPRCLELLFQGEFHVGPQFYLTNLPEALNEAEKTALDTVFSAFWEKFINTFPFPFGGDELLCGLAYLYSDLMPFLKVWELADSSESLRQLAFLAGEATYSGGWEHQPAQMKQMVDWLLNDSTIRKLEDGALKQADESSSFELLEAVETLTQWKQSLSSGTG